MAHFTDAHGVRIHYDVWRAADPVAIVQLTHGIGEHTGRYAWVIGELNAAGYTVYADDHRGHGRTGFEQHGGDLDRLGNPGPGGMRAAIAAVERFAGVIREAEPDLPLVTIAHSWGSLMAQIIVNRAPATWDGVVLTGTAYRTLRWMDPGYDLNRKHRRLGTTGMEWLSRDPAVAAAFVADPYTTATPLPKLFGFFDSLRLLGRPKPGLPPELPILIQVGSDDTLGGEESAKRLLAAYSRAGILDASLIVYDGARHEVLNETNRDEVLADTVRWLDERFATD
ncbi:alpha/beta hydrolase [Agromyces seonyuensis]|uniref:Alpha/beta fold hydrolase n=1 Tax=Agromyces seonyuensis TaxID=2662446 RepID=A0A6I4NV56_9MICO|nr:alpha/beta hydrolase [Agromyces seonyuensis]MWB97981.1 alpha/beta fold hydrolase [Agromyces seonyuensis]